MSVQADSLSAAAFNLTELVRLSATDPADGVRLLVSLYNQQAVPVQTGSLSSQAVYAVTALCRRACLVSLARACAVYQPSSSDDAATLRESVCSLFDAEVLIAADNGDINTYNAFRQLRSDVSRDLLVRGSTLPSLTTFTFANSLPAPVLAYRLYQDSTRTDELVARVNPTHPLFMPLEFEALSS